MPSASSAKSAKASSVPPADAKSVTVTTAKSSVVAVQLTNALSSIELKTSSAANSTGGGSVASAAVAVATNSIVTNVAAENHNSSAVSTPIKQMLVIVEHKIRNLEKRKTKLESYRAIQASGKELNADQKQAVAKYDEVMQCLEFARDLTKQMNQLSNNAEKEQKKVARREAILRAQTETVKIREVLTIQDVLKQFTDPTTREDFLAGENGAVKLEESDLELLEKFYFDITVKRQESPGETPFSVSAQKAAELLSFTIDGRPKPYGDTTYENVRKLFQNIQECGYFDLAGKVEATDEEIPIETEQSEQSADEDKTTGDILTGAGEQENAMEMVSNEMVQMHIVQPQQSIGGHVEGPKFEAPSAAAVPAPAFPQPAPMMQQQPPVQPPNMMGAGQIVPPQPQLHRPVLVPSVVQPAAVAPGGGVVGQQPPQVAQMPPAGVAPPPGAPNQMHGSHFPPTTVRAVEQGFYKQHQYIQQIRPLAEVIGSTNFYFLQESELDSPDMVPPAGYTPNDGQIVNPVMNPPGVLAPQQSPSTVPQSLIQQQPPLQQTQIGLVQQPGLQQKSQPTAASAIPSQTFTNQSFPPIVPPQAANMYPPNATQNPDLTGVQQQPQMPPVVYSSQQQPVGPGGIPMQSLVPTPQAVVSQQQSQMLNSMVDSQTVADVISQQAVANIANLMSGPPPGANVPIPGFPPSKFQQQQQPNPNLVGHLPTPATQLPGKDHLEHLQQQSQQQVNDHKQLDDLNDNRGAKIDSSQDWDAHEPHVQQKTHSQSMAPRQDDESNQWSNDAANNTGNGNKHDWNSNYDNQNDSNTWKNIPNDNYVGRGGGRNNYPNNNRAGGGGGSGRGGGSGMRGNNPGGSGGPASNGYRGRPNNYQQQQNNRNTGMYFRNNDGFYQNQNGNSGGYGNKDTSGGNYVGGSGGGGPSNNYRPRGGPMPPNGRQQSGGRLGGGPPNNGGGPQQSQTGRNSTGGPGGPNPNRSSNVGGGGGNMSSNPNTRPGRNNPGSAYGNSRPPPNNVRQQQDINA